MRLLPVGADHGGRGALKTTPSPTDADIDAKLTNICRCGTYPRIRKAVHRAARRHVAPQGAKRMNGVESLSPARIIFSGLSATGALVIGMPDGRRGRACSR